MASNSFHLYRLEPGAEFDDLAPLDFADVMWQAFGKDRLESITIEATRVKGRISIRILNLKHKRRKKQSK
jgi:hypothetical protein